MHRSTTLSALGLVACITVAGGLVTTPAAATTPTCFGEPATITGSGHLVGTSGPDVIVAESRLSRVQGMGGDDLICGAYHMAGGPGNDRIRYARAFDSDFMSIRGGRGADVIVVRSRAAVQIDAGPGDDVVDTAAGWQYVLGGPGRDRIATGPGNDEVHAGGGSDVVRGQRGRDEITGDGGDDLLRGGKGRDRLFDNGYDDQDSGTDTARGGPGEDLCSIALERRLSCERE